MIKLIQFNCLRSFVSGVSILTPDTLLFTHGEETLQVKLIQNYRFMDLL